MNPVLEKDTPESLQINDLQQSLNAFYQAAIEHNLPVVLWRYPNSHQAQGLVDLNGEVKATRIDFTGRKPGFAFSPFVEQERKATLFINAGIHLDSFGLHRYAHPTTSPNETRFLETFYSHQNQFQPIQPQWRTAPEKYLPRSIASRDEFCALVQDAVAYIKTAGIKKIVASRAAETPLSPAFDPVSTFNMLCQRYQHAFISLISIPGVGTWIGASPELLLSLSNDHLRTVALAGTQPRPTDIPPSAVTWGAKEIEEQALVSDYIRAFLQNLGLRSFAETGAHTVTAGKMVHLQTDFDIKLNSPQLLHLANQILNDLHPTSAVCGMPKKEALSFILEREGYNRAFYSGFLGPVHLNNESHLYVNLRCMQLQQANAVLYVGAGITQDSIPTAEWDETVLKSQTLLSVMA